jgi:ubiquinone/menaquinone biosynthesis C-methylase UbiE
MNQTNKNIPKSWDPIWNEVFLNQEWGKYPSENLIQFIARNFYNTIRKDIKILEVGCGTGANLWYLSREGFQAFGVDGSQEAVSQAYQRLKNENLIAKIEVADIINLPFKDNYFDAVIDVECLYCNTLDNSFKILKEIKRVLKPFGKLYSRTFTDKMFIGQLKENNLLEYSKIDEGPLNGKGFVRLTSKETIKNFYGKNFLIESLDILEYTSHNEKHKISEWVIIGVNN